MGKTTVLEELANLGDEFVLAHEPVAKWEDAPVGDGRRHNHLASYYNDRNGTTFRQLQSHVLLTLLDRYRRHERKTNRSAVVYERSVRVARCVFMALEKDMLDPIDFSFLEGLARYAEEAYERDALFIYLKCDEATMLHRVGARGRASEKNISYA